LAAGLPSWLHDKVWTPENWGSDVEGFGFDPVEQLLAWNVYFFLHVSDKRILMGERKRMCEVVKIAGWREEGEEEEEMGSRKRLTSLGVRTYSRQLLSRARKSSGDFNITQRLEVDAHVCACIKIMRSSARDLDGQQNEERNFFVLVEHCSTTTK
jgi:hypothetical protein